MNAGAASGSNRSGSCHQLSTSPRDTLTRGCPAAKEENGANYLPISSSGYRDSANDNVGNAAFQKERQLNVFN